MYQGSIGVSVENVFKIRDRGDVSRFLEFVEIVT